jgi:rsbT co-antagonist protein RsbR
MSKTLVPDTLQKDETAILADWVTEQLASDTMRRDLIQEDELRGQSQELLRRIKQATQTGELGSVKGEAWAPVREQLTELSRARVRMGFSPSETATFIFSLKTPLLSRLRQAHGNDVQGLYEDTTRVTTLFDKLGLYTIEVYQQSREEVINRQQEEMLELSTPVVKLWDGVLALPLIGTLDSARTSVVMEALLQKIVETGSEIAIIDITGVPTVDTLVAQHLLKTIAAARLMGADCIISGIRPQIAQTIVHLAIDLSQVITKATLAEALATALKKSNYQITKVPAATPAAAAELVPA